MSTVDFEDPTLIPVKPEASSTPYRWKYGLCLLAASAVSSVLLIPFSYELMSQSKELGVSKELLPAVLAIGVVIETFLAAVLIALGVGLGGRVGLGWPPIVGWGEGPEGRQQAWRAVWLAAGLGVFLGVVVSVAGSLAEGTYTPKIADLKHPSWVSSLFGSLGAGVREEIWLRYGLLTFFAWLGTVALRSRTMTAPVFWTANFLATLLFAAMHVPQAVALIGLSPAILAFIFLGNGVPGLFFGWLYWKRGLVSAMVCHFMLDVVLKVVAPLVLD
ncbi:MAG: CPBP family intramembrane glutamic endopeptidase [Isosphaeraceae bacterium]